MINIYTDGAYSQKRNKGSYACLVFSNRSHEPVLEKTGIIRFGTPNIAELYGLLAALRIAISIQSIKITIHCDSMYCVNTYNGWMDKWKKKGWRLASGKPVANQELIEQIYNLKEQLTSKLKDVRVKWVKGHNGDVRNELADQKAKELVYE